MDFGTDPLAKGSVPSGLRVGSGRAEQEEQEQGEASVPYHLHVVHHGLRHSSFPVYTLLRRMLTSWATTSLSTICWSISTPGPTYLPRRSRAHPVGTNGEGVSDSNRG